MFIELPRNFQFINRLSGNFVIEIINLQNQTAKGIWYLAKINDQRLNILSRVNLNVGKKYLVTKNGKINIKIIKELSLDSKGEDGKLITIEEKNPKSGFKEKLINLFERNDNNIQENRTQTFSNDIFYFMQALSLNQILNQKKSIEYNKQKKQVSFSFVHPAAGKITGLFIQNKDLWDLLINISDDENNANLINFFRNNLKDILSDLFVRNINYTDENQIAYIKKGIDINL
ncbi:MAG: hypothetical protein OEZ13_01670 [Spirochaetia bacterium]|nr:hypothetical protein [Spirochaetia bacterium]